MARRKHHFRDMMGNSIVQRNRVRKGRPAQCRGNLQFEQLEARRVLTGPTLLGVSPNDGSLLTAQDVLLTSPSELTLSFEPGQVIDTNSLAGIQLVGGGGDGVIDGDDAPLELGYVGVGEAPNEIVVRFAETLPDDIYELRVGTPLQNINNEAFNEGNSVTVPFSIDLGANVVAVVPQPIDRGPDGSLSQRRDQIVVYFSNDDLNLSAAQNPAFYQLIWTGHDDEFDSSLDTVNNLDDGAPISPISVVYNAGTDSAVLTFATDIEDSANGPGTYRLRIGTNESPPVPPVTLNPADDPANPMPGQTVDAANGILGNLTGQAKIVSDFIGSIDLADGVFITPPGGENDPGHRLAGGDDRHVLAGPDADENIPVFVYNFAGEYGPSGGPTFVNQITETQKELAREVFDIYSYYLGVQFVETDGTGITIATGREEAIGGVTVVGSNFDESYGGDWFQQAMTLVGFQLLDLGYAEDLPPGTIMAGPDGEFLGLPEDSLSANPRLTFGREPEPIFPGDHDITHGQHLFFPTADDVDMYRFTLTEPGTVSLETFAERRTNASNLDTVLRLFQGTDDPLLVAQNDDYFGSDSLIEVELGPGTYFVGVSSAGNDQYDAAFPTFTGGRTEGEYDLRVDFRSAADNSIVDTTGRRLDGDNDGQPGGEHNFWFRAQTEQNTIYVDKTAGSGDGAISSPYNNLQTAVSAASAGDIVRVVGNNFADANPLNDAAYEIGISSGGDPLPDGGVDGLLRIGKGVTVMVDAGSLFKLRRGAILVGSDSAIIDKSGGAIQLLGTPEQSVTFTSYNDESLGIDNNPLVTAPLRGDWGGIIIRNDASRAADQFDYEAQGIFLNYINFADMQYGGGILSVNSVAQEVNPVTLIDARPSVTNNEITQSASAALAVSPNSFEETNFLSSEYQTIPFTPDYGRVGPNIHGNSLTANNINGMLIVNRATSFEETLVMSVSGRFDDTDIVHVITENLFVDSDPGGLFDSGGTLTGRQDSRLAIDPGTVVKLDDGLIEVGMGATILAEGTSDNPIVFTSILDSRFGTGGTFDTAAPMGAASGDWSGVFLHPTSRGSFDQTIFAYAGGESSIEGNLAGFNPIEIYQADARITNSTFEFNDTGLSNVDTGNRVGRGANEAATIFVRGAQPIIVGNLFRDNAAATVNINVNALNFHNTLDYGRQTGAVDRFDGFLANQGPLIRNNVLDRNGINGMVVRGGTLTTESVWDDTDMVHVLLDGVYVPNHHTFGGLRLKSSQTESLVVKLDGDSAGFSTTGSAIGIPDHIGGSMQVLGQPGRPVVLTSLFDDSVGAGVDSTGATQADTNNGGRPMRSVPLGGDNGFQIDVNLGPNIQQFEEVVNAVQFAVDVWEEQLQDSVSIVIDVDLATLAGEGLTGFPGASTLSAPTVFNYEAQLFDTTPITTTINYNAVQSALISDAGDHESLVKQLPDSNSLEVNFPANSAVPFAAADEMRLTTANAKALALSTGTPVPSAYDTDDLAIDGTILINENLDLFDFDRTNGTLSYREDFQTQMLREVGEILGFDSSLAFVNGFLANPLEPDPINPELRQEIFLTPLDLFRFAPGDAESDFTNASRLLDPQLDEHVFYAGSDLDFTEWPYEAITTGEIPIEFGNWRGEYLFREGELEVFEPIGIMDPASALRDNVLRTHDSFQSTQGIVLDITEADRLAFDSIGYDVVGPTPGAWRGITMHELTYDGNIEYVLEAERPTGEGTGINATPGTAQSIGSLAPDLDSGNEVRRLGFEVHGVINNDADVDVYSFVGVAGTKVWLDIDQSSQAFDSVVELVSSSGTPLAGSDDSLFEAAGLDAPTGSGQPFNNADIYSTNLLDAGMQVTLPGPAGFETEFYVRVSSFDADLDFGTPDGTGDSQGRYELQIRLQSKDVVPGTTVQYADIRYAENGIKIYGPPSDSPLVGEQSEDESINDNFSESVRFARSDDGFVVTDSSPVNTEYPYEVSAQKLGNLLTSRQGAISVAGALEGFGDVDWYQFEVSSRDYSIFNNTGFVDLIFDIDYADGLGRPNTALSVYRESGPGFGGFSDFGNDGLELIYYGETSDLIGDQVASTGDLVGGSYGSQDPYIGPVSLPFELLTEGLGLGFGGLFDFTSQYYVAVSPINLVPSEIVDDQTTLSPVLGDENGNRGFAVSTTIEFDPLDPPKPDFVFNPNAPFGSQTTGAYQLEIRVAHPNVGDANRERLQGQILISNNFISDSQEFGISVVDGLRDLPSYGGAIGGLEPRIREILEDDIESPSMFGGSIRQQHGQFTSADYAPHSGGVARNLPNQNEERVTPGITVSNNVISGGFEGGVEIKGDPGGIVLNTYNLTLLFDLFDDTDCGDAQDAEFTIWDHQGNSQTFDFIMAQTGSEPGKIPIRYDCAGPEAPNPGSNGTAASVLTLPTATDDLRAEIEHALRLSDLDIKVHKVVAETGSVTVPTSADDTETISYEGSATFFIEGAAKIGLMDIAPGKDSPFIPGDIDDDLLLPAFTAFVAQQGAVPYARVINNTLVGRGGDLFDGNGAGDVGIIVEDNASPTIMNNIISNFDVGIRSDFSANDSAQQRPTFLGNDFPINQSAFGPANFEDNDQDIFANGGDGFLGLGATGIQLAERNVDEDFISVFPILGSRPTVVSANAYQGNANDTLRINEGTDQLLLETTDPLFVDAANGNFFLAQGSQALNSSNAFLNERNYLSEVQTTVGLTPTQIQSPRTDALGILRDDGFADRGALERADFVGPTAQLVNPQPLVDDPTSAVATTTLTDFTVQLQDGASLADPVFGSGIDDNTVVFSAVTLLQDGSPLVEDEDFVLNYNAVNDFLQFTPAAGIWPVNSVYTIILDNTVIMDRAANTLQANQLNGTTTFTVSTGGGTDFGDAPAPYPTLLVNDGARHAVGSVFLGSGVSADGDGKPSPNAGQDSRDDGVALTNVFPGATANFTVTASANGFLNGWIDFNQNGSWSDAGEQIAVDRQVVGGTNQLSFQAPAGALLGTTYARFRFSTASGLGITGAAPDGEVEDYAVRLDTSSWQNPIVAVDVNDDENVNPQDIIIVINELTNHAFSDPETGQLQPTPPADNDFYDVNGDGFVSPRDALAIINFLAGAAVQAPLSGGVTSGDDWFVDEDEEETTAPMAEQDWTMDDILDDVAGEIAAVWNRNAV